MSVFLVLHQRRMFSVLHQRRMLLACSSTAILNKYNSLLAWKTKREETQHKSIFNTSLSFTRICLNPQKNQRNRENNNNNKWQVFLKIVHEFSYSQKTFLKILLMENLFIFKVGKDLIYLLLLSNTYFMMFSRSMSMFCWSAGLKMPARGKWEKLL